MRFLIVTHVIHKNTKDRWFAYGPYVKEMNLWIRHVDEVVVVAPVIAAENNPIDLSYDHRHLRVIKVGPIAFTTVRKTAVSIFRLPGIFYRVYREMRRCDHIHLRCPGNMGLIGCFAQIFFPGKIKSAKYAANWDLKSKQPFTYRIQQGLIRNTFLTKNMTGLVYGAWPDHTTNIKPFFTASYSQNEMKPLKKKILIDPIRLLFVGMLRPGKQPMLSAKVCLELNNLGIQANLHIYGEGSERETLQQFIRENNMQDKIILYGNQPQSVLQEAYQKSHFLIFLSKSEGWPKAVAEAMWWGCLPITSAVSCVSEMLGFGERGNVVNSSVNEVCDAIIYYKNFPNIYQEKCAKAARWARRYTLELFENEIQKIIHAESLSDNR